MKRPRRRAWFVFVLATAVVSFAAPASGKGPSCVFRVGGALPDTSCTPGATNPAVTQGDLRSTICKPGWTALVRPSSSVTAPEKLASMREYGVGNFPPASFEYDHLIPLELGGAVNDLRNLWPEYRYLLVGGREQGAYTKDAVENALKTQVCAGKRSLRSAQNAIARDWRTAL